MRTAHLVRRFFGSLRPGGPGPDAEAWVAQRLLPGEQALWRRMSGPDRRHAFGVARRVEATLGPGATRPVFAAALLHDCGKVESGLRTPGRVVATVVGGATPRMRRYREHTAIGAELLRQAGSDPLTIAWAHDHHQPESAWRVPVDVGRTLKAADDD